MGILYAKCSTAPLFQPKRMRTIVEEYLKTCCTEVRLIMLPQRKGNCDYNSVYWRRHSSILDERQPEAILLLTALDEEPELGTLRE